jgi:hypothetical protein
MTMLLVRRSALAALALAIGMAASGAPVCAEVAEAAGFAAPNQPMQLTRVLERELGDGAKVTVARTWRLRFVAHAVGYTVEGEQIAVEVDVPPRLAALAEVERKNSHAGPFPIALDKAGLIVREGGAGAKPIPGLEEAAKKYLEGAPLDRQAEALRYVRAVQQAGAEMTSRWPEDLFYPVAVPRHDERTLPLPGGGSGTIEVSFEGTLAADGRHLAAAERRIETTVNGTTRASRETWRLEPLE